MPTDHTLKPKQDAHPFLTAFQIVKDTLSCKKHPGENTWCWVDPAADSEHIPLCSHDIQLWAKYSVRQIYIVSFYFLTGIFSFSIRLLLRAPLCLTWHTLPTY
jgi:hypothetical protein